MKFLLIAPPYYRLMDYYNMYFPSGLASLAAVLRKEGHEVLIYDADYNVNPSKTDQARLEENYSIYLKSLNDNNHSIWQEMRKKIQNFNPDVVGITVYTPFAASAFKVASIVKGINKDLPVVMGGPHITIKYDEVIKICPDVDFLVRGEGDIVLSELVAYLEKKENGKELEDINGISYRDNGQIIHNPKGSFLKELDLAPFPARDLLIHKDFYNSEDMGLLMTSRGCPYNCSFCATSVWERKTRFRSVDSIIEEIKLVINTYGTTQFNFKDDSFTVDSKRIMEFCNRLIKENININWDCHTRVDLVDEELLIKMKASGCNKIKIGIETGSERILKFMNKKITLDQCRKAAKLFRKVGIYWTGYFMIGIPTETKKDMYKTLQFAKELQPDFICLNVYIPYPGTSLFDFGLKKGLVQEERTLDDFFNISPINYYIKDPDRRIDTMSNKEFEAIRCEILDAVHRYNMGFERLARKARSRVKIYTNEPHMIWTDLKKLHAWLR